MPARTLGLSPSPRSTPHTQSPPPDTDTCFSLFSAPRKFTITITMGELSPLFRGTVLLMSAAIATMLCALMRDDYLAPLYGIAFLPLYIFMLVVVIDELVTLKYCMRVIPVSTGVNMTYLMRQERYTKCVRMFNFTIWLIILILAPMYLSGYNTVPALPIAALIILWLVLVTIAQYAEETFPAIAPFGLRAMADYFSTPVSQSSWNHDDLFDGGAPSVPMEDIQPPDTFNDQPGTVRRMSVSESVRGSLRNSPLRVDDLGPPEDDYSTLPESSPHAQAHTSKAMNVVIDAESSESAARSLEDMATDNHDLLEAVMK